VDLDGNVTRVTDDGYDYSNPAWDPGGRSIVVRGRVGLDRVIETRQAHGSPVDLFVFSLDGSPSVNLTEHWDLMAASPTWSLDGRFIYFSTGVGGNTHLFRVAIDGGAVEQVTTGDRRIRAVSFAHDFENMAYQASDPTHPADIFVARSDGSNEQQLTESNADLLSEIVVSSAERLTFPSRDGTEIEGWIIPPLDYDPNDGLYPLILSIHGGPHSAYGNDFSFQWQLLAANGYFVLYINPRGSTGYGEQFLWATWGGWGILDYEDLMAGVDHAAEHYPIDESRLGVTGGSYGGFMTNWIVGHTQRFAAAVSRASISNWFSDYGVADIPRTKESEFFGPPWETESRDLLIELSPLTYAGNAVTPTLFLHGEIDYRVPIEEAEQMYVALRKNRVPARFVRYPESYHGGWTPWRQVHSYLEQLQWWNRYLGAP
jgi:dipeptidyl aminopeptidase/acylaminoacyl peptidase